MLTESDLVVQTWEGFKAYVTAMVQTAILNSSDMQELLAHTADLTILRICKSC